VKITTYQCEEVVVSSQGDLQAVRLPGSREWAAAGLDSSQRWRDMVWPGTVPIRGAVGESCNSVLVR